MNDEERRRRIAEAAYYRSERRGFAGDRQLDDWLAAERDLAGLVDPGSEQTDGEPEPVPVPDQASGVPVPAPLAKEERIRSEEVKQSAHDLSAATAAGLKKKAERKPAGRKSGKGTGGRPAESRRSV